MQKKGVNCKKWIQINSNLNWIPGNKKRLRQIVPGGPRRCPPRQRLGHLEFQKETNLQRDTKNGKETNLPLV
jgi:hypothetical protein